MIHLSNKNTKIDASIDLTSSKSQSNRALIIQSLCLDDFGINNLAIADDTVLLNEALKDYKSKDEIYVGHAGTAFRFMTSFLAVQKTGSWILTGSSRMKERPIGVLVNALKSMGAKIKYIENEGYPPLQITGTSKLKKSVCIDAGVSSQYISSLLLIAPSLQGGLDIKLWKVN